MALKLRRKTKENLNNFQQENKICLLFSCKQSFSEEIHNGEKEPRQRYKHHNKSLKFDTQNVVWNLVINIYIASHSGEFSDGNLLLFLIKILSWEQSWRPFKRCFVWMRLLFKHKIPPWIFQSVSNVNTKLQARALHLIAIKNHAVDENVSGNFEQQQLIRSIVISCTVPNSCACIEPNVIAY